MDNSPTIVQVVTVGDFGDIDGASAQEKAVELGILVEKTFTEPCGERCVCADVGEPPYTCYRLNEAVRAVRKG